MLGQDIYDELPVGRVHEHAGLEADRRPHRCGEITAYPGQNRLVRGHYAPVDGIGVDVLVAVAEFADLETFAVRPLGNAVEVAPLRAVEDKDGERLRRELPVGRPEPSHDLTLRDRQG